MIQHLDHHDAELLIHIYEIRREEKLRKARDWFLGQLVVPDSIEQMMKQYPMGTDENAYFRMVVSYWEMAASILNHGLINDELFFENNSEMWAVWNKIKALTPAWREMWKNPLIWKNLETAAEKYEKWVNQHAPDALARRREIMKTLTAKKA